MKCVLGDVFFTVVSEEVYSMSNNITDRPVEQGLNITDHAKTDPREIDISGYVTGEDAAASISLLRGYVTNKNLLTYVGRNIMRNMLIERFDTVHEIRNGFEFNIRLKEVRIARKKKFEIANPQASSILEQGLQVVAFR